MKAGGCTFTDGKQSCNALPGDVLHFTKRIGGNTAHVVVIARMHGAKLSFRIQIKIFFKKSADFGNLLIMDAIREMTQIDPDMLNIMVGIQDASSGANFRGNRPRHQIPGRQFLHFGCIVLHKSLLIAVTQNTAYRPQGFTGQNAGAYNSGRMKLDGLRIHHGQSGLKNERQTVSGILTAIGCDLENLTASPGG